MKNRLPKTIAVTITLSLFLVTNSIASDIDILEQRMRGSMLEGASAGAAGEYLSSSNPNGSWEDVDYASIARAKWSPATHLARFGFDVENKMQQDNFRSITNNWELIKKY